MYLSIKQSCLQDKDKLSTWGTKLFFVTENPEGF